MLPTRTQSLSSLFYYYDSFHERFDSTTSISKIKKVVEVCLALLMILNDALLMVDGDVSNSTNFKALALLRRRIVYRPLLACLLIFVHP